MKIKKILALLISSTMLFTTGCNQSQKIETKDVESTQNESYATSDSLTGTTWFCAELGENNYMMSFKENGEFSSNYIEEYDELSMGNFNHYSYDQEKEIITLSNNNDKAKTAELKILYHTENSIIFEDENESITQYVTQDALSKMPKPDFIHSSVANNYRANAALNVISIKDGIFQAEYIGYDTSAKSDLLNLAISSETSYYLLEIEKGKNAEDVVRSFKHVKLTEQGVEELMAKGPCRAYVSISDYNKVDYILFYSETQVDSDMNYANFFIKNDSGTKSSIIGTAWHMLAENDELSFTEDGEFYYGYDGSPRGMSDCYPYYEYDEEKGIITVFDETKEHSSTIKILEHTPDKLVLQMGEKLDEGTYTFVTSDNQVNIPYFDVSEHERYSPEIKTRIESINDNSITAKDTVRFEGNLSEDCTLMDDTTYFIVEKLQDEAYDKEYKNYRYIQLTKNGAQKLLAESACRAFVSVDYEKSTFQTIIFSPAWQVIE